MSTRVIFDTDIGTDVDDLFALALILASPELHLEGISCSYGDVSLRARMALKVLELHGSVTPPVLMGVRKPLLGLHPVYWLGHEGSGILAAGDAQRSPSPEHASDFMIRTAMSNPGEIHLICTGPLTTLALALLKEPRLAENVKHITLMGGILRGANMLSYGYVEHNIASDPEAAHVVFASGAPITLIPLDVTEQVKITAHDLIDLRTYNDDYHRALTTELGIWFRHLEDIFGEPVTFTYMHDPLTVASVIQPDLVKLMPVHLDVELHGSYATGATLMRRSSADYPTNVYVALEVDAIRFEQLLRTRVFG